MRIAIIGAGIAGLTCAHLLHPEHEITVFEAAERPGGHTWTVEVETGRKLHRIDTGFIVYNDRNYPGFERLLERLGVATQPSVMSFSVSDGRGEFEYNGASANGLFARRSSLVRPSFHRMVRGRLRLSTPVARVERFPDRVEVTPGRGGPERFDEVVLAVHSTRRSRCWPIPAPPRPRSWAPSATR
jgi:predicted NAD/FAD-binding protein